MILCLQRSSGRSTMMGSLIDLRFGIWNLGFDGERRTANGERRHDFVVNRRTRVSAAKHGGRGRGC